MHKRTGWLLASCAIVTALALASCDQKQEIPTIPVEKETVEWEAPLVITPKETVEAEAPLVITPKETVQGVGTEILDTKPPDTFIANDPRREIYYNKVTFHYSGSDDVTPTSSLIYSCKLEGYDSDWSTFVSVPSKSYSDLPKGLYIFKVKAKDEAQNVDPSPAERLFSMDETNASPIFTVGQCFQVNGIDIEAEGGYASPFVVDWNNDGMKDILIGGGRGYVNLYLNSGIDSEPSFTSGLRIQAKGTDIQVGHYGEEGAHPFVVDWNNDGRKDLLVGDGRGYVFLYLNSGTDSEPSFNSGIEILANNAPIYVAESIEKRKKVPSSQADPFVIDWNNDGKKDLLVGSGKPGYVYLFINVGTDTDPVFPSGTQIQTASTGIDLESVSPRVVDWNGDGAKDLLIGNHYGGVSVCINSGDDSTPVFPTITDIETNAGIFFTWDSTPCIVDWNNDGVYDLVVGGNKGLVDLYIADISASSPPVITIQTPEDNTDIETKIVTISGTVDDALFSHSRAILTVNGITQMIRVKDGSFSNKVVLIAGSNTIRVEAINAAGTGYDVITINASIPNYPSFAEGYRIQAIEADLEILGIVVSVSVVDWNNDGLNDFVTGSYSCDDAAPIFLYLNNGTDGIPVFTTGDRIAWSRDKYIIGGDPIIVDWNGDGKKDLLTGGYVYINEGSHSSPLFPRRILISEDLRGFHPFVTDWNNDGRKDLLVGHDGTGGQAYIDLYLNTGTDDAPTFSTSARIKANGFDISESNSSVPYVLDWDGDGKKDLLVRESYGFYCYLNVGKDSLPTFANKISIQAGGSPFKVNSGDVASAFSVVDWNNDGSKDLIIGDYDGFVNLFLGSTTEVLPVPTPAPVPAPALPAPEEGIEVGKLAPDFQLQNLYGQKYSLGDFRGKAVLLNFWATWCGPCRAEMPFLQLVHEEQSGEELVILAVNIGGSQSEVEEFMEEYDLSFLALLDTGQDVALEYNARAIPTTYFIDKNGIIQDLKIGAFYSETEIIMHLDKIIP